MRKLLYTLIFLLYQVTFSQNQTTISVNFTDASIGEVIQEIEANSNYHFYFVEEWLGDKRVTGNYNNVPVQEVLNAIFKDTVLNYYLLDNNEIVLIRNNVIYDELPENFFGREKVVENTVTKRKKNINPSFYVEQKSSTRTETFRIGKEDINSTRERYSLSGYVTNFRTGRPIGNLAIVVSGTSIGTQTDKNGFYQIDLPPGQSILETSSVGIQDSRKRVIIYNDGELDFELDESLEQLDEVILEGKVSKNVTETITGAEKIDVEESKNIPLVLGERDVFKVATALPGISTAGEGSAGFNVRGGKSDQNLILVDDAVIYSPQHFFGIFSALNPFSIEDVTVYKGSIPAEYGGRLSSVFDIKLKDGDTKKFGGEASIGPVTGNVVLDIPVIKDKSALQIGGRGAYANYILRSLDDESLKDSEASFYDANVKYTHRFNDNNKLSATGYISRDDFSITSDSLYIYNNRLLSLKWDHTFNDNNKGSLVLYNSEYKFNIEFDGGANNNFDLGFSVQETEAKLKMNHAFNDKYSLDYGVSSKLYSIEPGRIDPFDEQSIVTPLAIPEERALESAAFISGKLDFTEKFSVDAGFRFSVFNALGEGVQRIYEDGRPRSEATLLETQEFDKNEVIETYTGPEARLSLRYLLRPDLSIKASFNNTFQYIHRLSNNTTVSPIDTWKLSDLNIEPQQANQYSLGLYKNFEDDLYELSIEGFYKESENILDFKTGAQILLNETIEAEVLQGEGEAYGVEFLLKKTKGKLNGWLGYTYSRSFIKLDSPFPEERVNNGDFFPSNFDKPHDFSMVANYKFTKRFSLSANFVYQTGRPVTFPVGNFFFNGSETVVFSDRNRFRIPDFYRLDLGFNIEGNHKKKKLAHSFWTISIYNVLGRNNPFSVFFVTEDGEVKSLQSSIFSIPVPSITYNFKF
ncbi:TonB-dependent receptor [Aquimarina spongiae]|uniref:Outer membrane receptor for ferrienterochelin and colicins n=1 Tax=Aquimarina spongiae TaxID=570521 RepID=A0A1M6G9T2_9FLAO|nr:TonB-dependent receptor [Aquimarina spongiae]SHJ06607.1 Outer membrane receptor for ferrienterochelin and colicins [Aquimarina spongiae]